MILFLVDIKIAFFMRKYSKKKSNISLSLIKHKYLQLKPISSLFKISFKRKCSCKKKNNQRAYKISGYSHF